MREEIQAYVSLGSNSGDAARMLQLAREALGNLPHVRLGASSPIYTTEPQGFADQPWFLNQVVELFVASSWQACSFVEALLQMEASLGRVRSADPALRFGPRAIDADLLLFGQQRSQDTRCLVPHPRLIQRAFALVPLLDVAPGIRIDGISATVWLSRLKFKKDGQKISQ